MRTKNLHFDFDLSETLVDFCLNYVTGVSAWEQLLTAGARAMIPILDPLHRSTFAQEMDEPIRDPLDEALRPDNRIPSMRIRLSSYVDPLDQGLENMIAFLQERLTAVEKKLHDLMPDPNYVYGFPKRDQRATNAERLVTAYNVLSAKNVRVKLTCKGVKNGDYEEIYLDLPAETL